MEQKGKEEQFSLQHTKLQTSISSTEQQNILHLKEKPWKRSPVCSKIKLLSWKKQATSVEGA